MNAATNPVQAVWVIRQDPKDEASLFTLPIDEHKFGVLLFSQSEHAKEFARSFPDMIVRFTDGGAADDIRVGGLFRFTGLRDLCL